MAPAPATTDTIPPDAASRPGIYVHVPFCRHRCAYCDFYSTTDLPLTDAYVAAVIDEIDGFEGFSVPADSLYVGGGTPTVLTNRQLERILDALSPHSAADRSPEITVEANPGTLMSPGRLAELRRCGVNRLNIGVQSFDDRRLAFLGRIHTAAQARQSCMEARRAGFDNLGIDLIYGLPGQTRQEWRRQLETAVDQAPDHLSCYLLSIEPGTALFRRRQRGAFRLLGESETADLFRMTHDLLDAAGYPAYEVSNFARAPECRSRHNRKYWNHIPYRGFGPSAHSFDGRRRWWNVADLDRYLAAMAAGSSPAAGSEHLTQTQQMIEALYLGLRQTRGIDLAAFQRRFGVAFAARFAKELEPLVDQGLVAVELQRCRLTPDGRVLLDSVAGRLAQAT